MTTDCGCWTDGSGYWRLSEQCRKAEKDAWSRAVEFSRNKTMYYAEPLATTHHERAVAYFRQELGKSDMG